VTRYLFDTNICIAIMAGSAIVRDHLNAVSPREIGIPVIVAHELWFGVSKSSMPDLNRERYAAFRDAFPNAITLDEGDARQAGEIRAELQRTNQSIGPYDTLIAGQALARGFILVTADEREFRRVNGLRWENCAKA
jgi:tRNA(fMet)-specific endonuclease VapC